MNLTNLKSLFADKGCKIVYVKELAANDNSKNQVYLGGSFEVINILPISNIVNESAGDWERERFKAGLNFSWIDEAGNLYPAPHSQLILYPKYPEVRFSGFLKACDKPPSELMTKRLSGRLLFLSVTESRNLIGYVCLPQSEVAIEFYQLKHKPRQGVFDIIELQEKGSKQILLAELKRIHLLGLINSKRLNSAGNLVPCDAPQCGGYTLEAELGIRPNSSAKPDFLGWEIKQFSVKNFGNINSAVITLMTPEPTGGYYVIGGVEAFIRKYGYKDMMGRQDRQNFGGVYKCNEKHKTTNLELKLSGFDAGSGRIRRSDGKIVLEDDQGEEAASWNFSSLLLHWNRKHNQACYIPSRLQRLPVRKYEYGNKVILGTGTDFQLFLTRMASGQIYYDPGIKMENVSSRPTIKRRSQFRIKSRYLSDLYTSTEIIDLNEEE